MSRRVSLSLVACACLLGAPACKSSQSSQPPAEPQMTQTTAGTPDRQFTTADTFGVLHSIHAGEVERGTLAQKKATDPRVRAYAEKVVNDHRSRMQKDDQLMSGLGISARETDMSQQIRSASDRETSNLASLSGSDFDRTYLDGQIGYYRMVLDTMDTELIPNTRDPQIRGSLQNARERANDHLREAQDLRNSLAATTPGGTQ